MKSTLPVVALFCCLVAPNGAAPSLPVNPGGIGGLFLGPNSETIIQGPDGSQITSAAEGGQVLAEATPIIVAEEVVPVISEPVAVAAPTPVLVKQDDTQKSDLVGPSGTISTRGRESIVAGPASTTITDPAGNTAETVPIIGEHAAVVAVAPPLLATSLPLPAVDLPVITATAAPAISLASASPVALTASPLALGALSAPLSPVQADLGSVSITASPLSIQTASDISLSAGNVVTADAISVTASPLLLPSVTPLQPIASSASPGLGSATTLGPISSSLAPGLIGINDHIDLGPQVNLNPALIPSANIIPPEILLSSTPAPSVVSSTVLAPQDISSGLASATNVQRNDALQLTPNDLLLGNNGGVLISPNGSPIGLGGTTDPRLLTSPPRVVNVVPKLGQLGGNLGGNDGNLIRNGDGTVSTLTAIQEQDLINAELAKVGVDGGQIQVTNVPLSSVTPLQQQQPLLRNTKPCCDEINPITSGDSNSASPAPVGENWTLTTRYGRDAKKD